MNTKRSEALQFSLAYLLAWLAGWAGAIACGRAALAGGNGWLVGYPKLILFVSGLLLVIGLLGDPARRFQRWLIWPLAGLLCLVVVTSGFLIWYAESFKAVFIKRGIADAGQIGFHKLTWNPRHLVVLKYHVSDLPDCENTGYLIPWRDGGRSLSDDYLEGKAGT